MPRNPFNVMDVPDPNDEDVKAFAAGAALDASAQDDNAKAWAIANGPTPLPSKGIGPAGGMAAWIRRSRAMPRRTGSKVMPR